MYSKMKQIISYPGHKNPAYNSQQIKPTLLYSVIRKTKQNQYQPGTAYNQNHQNIGHYI